MWMWARGTEGWRKGQRKQGRKKERKKGRKEEGTRFIPRRLSTLLLQHDDVWFADGHAGDADVEAISRLYGRCGRHHLRRRARGKGGGGGDGETDAEGAHQSQGLHCT